MKVDNWKELDEDKLFPCYSKNLYKFLRFHKKIIPIAIDTNKKNNKKFSVFVKGDELQKCLDEWAKNKEEGNLFFKKEG